MQIKPSELRVDTFRTGGSYWANDPLKGVRITHLPSGRIFESTDKRSQHANRAEAYKMLEQFLTTYKPTKQGNIMELKLSPALKAHLLHLGIESVDVQDNRVFGYKLKEGVTQCNLTNRDVGVIIRTWKCCEGEFLEHEFADEMAKVFYVEFQGFFTEWKQGNNIPPKGDVNALIENIGTREARRILSRSVGYDLIVYEGKMSFTRQELLQSFRELN